MARIDVTLSFGTAHAVRFRDALEARYGAWSSEIANPDYDPGDPESPTTVPNPESRNAYSRRLHARYCAQLVRDTERATAVAAARETTTEIDVQ